MHEHLRPQYAKKFHCIGGECEETCCRAWTVIVDKASYEKYQTLPALSSRMNECFVLREKPNERDFAIIRYTPAGFCPFLSAEGLCGIQKDYGAEYLSVTCATYPRNPVPVDAVVEHPLCLSCPEAARVVLLDPELMPDSDETREQRYAQLLSVSGKASRASEPMGFFWDIREFSLALVRDRAYQLWQRLFILGMFCKRLEAVLAEGQIVAVPDLVRRYAEIALKGDLRTSMDGIPVRVGVQVRMLMEVVQRYLRHQDEKLSRIQECLEDFGLGIEFEQAAPCLDKCTANYEQAYERYYAPFMEKHPFLLENYLINYIFATRFPFRVKTNGEPEHPHHEFLLLCVEFAVIKGLLIGIAGRHREKFGSAHAVKLVQSVAKTIEHSKVFRNALNWQGLADASSVAALLKN